MHIVCSETYWNLQLRYYTGAQEIVNNKLKFLTLDDPGDSDWPKPLAYKIRKSLYYHISSPVGMLTIYLTSRVTVGEKGKEKNCIFRHCSISPADSQTYYSLQAYQLYKLPISSNKTINIEKSSYNSKASQGKELSVSGNAWSNPRQKISREIKTGIGFKSSVGAFSLTATASRKVAVKTHSPFSHGSPPLPIMGCQNLFVGPEAWSLSYSLWNIKTDSWKET